MCIRTEILTVEDLRRNVLSKKMCFHFHDYPVYTYMTSVLHAGGNCQFIC